MNTFSLLHSRHSYIPSLLERRLVQRRHRRRRCCCRRLGRRVDLEQRRRRGPRGARVGPRRAGPLPERGQRGGELAEEALLEGEKKGTRYKNAAL